MYEKLTDEELRKAQRQNRITFVKRELNIIIFFATALLVYLAAEKGMWWLLCGGAFFMAACVFVYSLCFISQSSDERLGLNEWQQGERNEPQKQ
jgi:F0F1-type ATP synthase assembly protein I